MDHLNHEEPVQKDDGYDYPSNFPTLGGSAPKTLPGMKNKSGKSLIGRKFTRATTSGEIKKHIIITAAEKKSQSQDVKKILNNIQQATSTSISAVHMVNGSLKISISGKDEAAVNQAARKCKSSLETQQKKEIRIPKEAHRFILGKGGKNLSTLESATNTRVRIPGPNDKSDTIVIHGSKQGIAEVTKKMNEIVVRQQGRKTTILEIPKIYHPFIFGSNGATKEKILANSRAIQLNIPPPNKTDIKNPDQISIVGDDVAVQIAVDMVNEIYLRLKDDLKEITVDFPKEQHRYIIGGKLGAGVNKIMEKHEVLVDVPDRSDNSLSIKLRGANNKMAGALNEVYLLANKYSKVVIPCEKWVMPKLIGNKGSEIKKLNPFDGNDGFVKVDFKKDTSEIEISGEVVQVETVENNIRKAISQITHTTSSKEIKFANKFHGRLIGPGGASLKAMIDGRDVNIRLPKKDGTVDMDLITIEGSPKAVDAVYRELAVKKLEMEGEQEEVLNLDNKYHMYFFRDASGQDKGKKEKFESLKNRYPDVRVFFPKIGTESNEVKIVGQSNGVSIFAKEMKAIYNEIIKEHTVGNLLVAKKFHKNIIGKQGKTINDIKSRCNVLIDIPDSSSDGQIIKITGTANNVKRAKDEIMKIESELAKIDQAEVKIPKSTYKYLIGQKGANISSLRNEFEVAIQFPDEKSDSEKVIIRGDAEQVAKCKVKLMEMASQKIENFYTESIKCAKENRKYLVGRQGQTRQDFQVKFSVTLNIPEDGDSDISVIGKKENVKVAMTELEKIIKNLDDQKEITTSLPKEFHKRLIADRYLNKIMNDYNTKVTLPPVSDETDSCKLKGPKNMVDDVVKYLNNLILGFQNETTITVEIPTRERRSLIGQAGSNINALQEKHGVRINVPKKSANGSEVDDDVTEVTLVGPKDQVEIVKETILNNIHISEMYDLSAEFHGLLLGQNGKTIRELSTEWKVTIKVPKRDDENKDSIQIIGHKNDLENAKLALNEKKSQWEEELHNLYLKSYTCPVEVPESFHYKLIGYKGENIKAMQEKYNVNIKLPRSKNGNKQNGDGEENPDEIFVTGLQEDVHTCVDEIIKFVDDLENSVAKDVEVRKAAHSYIIGEKGRRVRTLKKKFSVEITFPGSTSEKEEVTVSGTNENVDMCIDEILNLEAEYLAEKNEGGGEIDPQYKPKYPGQECLYDLQKKEMEREAHEKRNKNKKNNGYKVTDAPWSRANGDNKESFPTLHGQSNGSGDNYTYQGAWGQKRF